MFSYKPVHSLLLVKSIPRMRFDDSRPSLRKASVTCKCDNNVKLIKGWAFRRKKNFQNMAYGKRCSGIALTSESTALREEARKDEN